MTGPLTGVKVLEMAGIGPGPYAAMLLADMGADVVRLQRPDVTQPEWVVSRGRRQLIVDMKSDEGKATCRQLAGVADVIIEGFRPGVMERLGLGPDILCADNARLIYARMTGWGQFGPYAHLAGHDINYISVAGALGMFGPAGEPPVAPLNLVGDFGGGSLFLVNGICAALYERSQSGKGQVIDCAMSDGAASLTTLFYGMKATGRLTGGRAENLLDGGAPFYKTYGCKDGGYFAVGPLEPAFFADFVAKLGVADHPAVARRNDPAVWTELATVFEAQFATRTRDEWAAIFADSDACATPILGIEEAHLDPHNRARETFVTIGGNVQPNVAPRFSRTPGAIGRPAPVPGQNDDAVLSDWLASPAS